MNKIRVLRVNTLNVTILAYLFPPDFPATAKAKVNAKVQVGE